MKWITDHNIKILDIDYKTKTCRVNCNGRLYGCPMRKHENNWYFSVDDRCVWYLAKDVKMSLCYHCEEGENLGDWDYEDWVCCRCHKDERLPDGEDCEFFKPFCFKTRGKEAMREKIYGDGYQDGYKDGYDKGYADAQALYKRPQDKRIYEIIEEFESRKDYGTEYAQAMEDAIVVLKAMLGLDKENENE